MPHGFRPPAVPLVTSDPYFSLWSMADQLTDDHTRHWTGRRQALVGLARIDGRPFRFMGRVEPEEGAAEEPAAMEQRGLRVTPLSSTYTFEAGGVALEVRFTSPLLPDDLDLLSRPASYIAFSARSLDGQPHTLSLYLDATGELCVDTPGQAVEWGRKAWPGEAQALFMGTQAQPVLQRWGDDVRIDWGYLYLVVPAAFPAQATIAPYTVRRQWLQAGHLPAAMDERMPRPVQEETPVLACALDLGAVGPAGASAFLVLGYDDVYSVEYFGRPLPGYWHGRWATADQMLRAAVRDFPEVQERCIAFERELLADAVRAGGELYADILSLAYRQAIAAHKLVRDERGQVLFMSKECFSNGCMSTVDVSYPSTPLFLLYNPELVRGMLRPIFRFARSDAWPFPFAPHDVGSYPKAYGQCYADGTKLEGQMPVEESGNMLIMTAAACLADGRFALARENWDLLTRWAQYLRENGFDPGNQLCTDDFAGHLAHNTNLSIKAILGLAAYGLLAQALEEREEASRYGRLAAQMALEWEARAQDGDHYRLTFDGPGTWSLKYNLLWDRLFNLNLFPPAVRERETAQYLRQRNRYGTPLDSRAAYTKADWLAWVAALAGSRADFERLIEPLWRFLHESESRVPLTDWYDTVTGRQMGMQHRPVVGGLFARLLVEKGLQQR